MNALQLIDTNADNIYYYRLCSYRDAKKEDYRPKSRVVEATLF